MLATRNAAKAFKKRPLTTLYNAWRGGWRQNCCEVEWRARQTNGMTTGLLHKPGYVTMFAV